MFTVIKNFLIIIVIIIIFLHLKHYFNIIIEKFANFYASKMLN